MLILTLKRRMPTSLAVKDAFNNLKQLTGDSEGVTILKTAASELVQLKLNIETSVGDSAPK
jgi:hypothetical protein